MRTMKLNQKGLTLVELLGALTLVFILGIGIFTTLSNSLNLFQRESNRIDVRGQANMIANQLTTFYQQNGDFIIVPIEDGVRIESGGETRTYSLPGHLIEIRVDSSIETDLFTKREITITMTGDGEPFILETVVSRLREGTS